MKRADSIAGDISQRDGSMLRLQTSSLRWAAALIIAAPKIEFGSS
jgi:hypothetical protein